MVLNRSAGILNTGWRITFYPATLLSLVIARSTKAVAVAMLGVGNKSVAVLYI